MEEGTHPRTNDKVLSISPIIGRRSQPTKRLLSAFFSPVLDTFVLRVSCRVSAPSLLRFSFFSQSFRRRLG